MGLNMNTKILYGMGKGKLFYLVVSQGEKVSIIPFEDNFPLGSIPCDDFQDAKATIRNMLGN